MFIYMYVCVNNNNDVFQLKIDLEKFRKIN